MKILNIIHHTRHTLQALALATAWMSGSAQADTLPVTDGLVVWLKADAVNPADTSQVRVVGADTFVKQWIDSSGGAHHATNATDGDQPTYIASGLNGKPVLRFAQDNDDNGDRLYLGDLSALFPSAGSVFAVSTISSDGRYNLFGNRNAGDERWVADSWNESHPGSFRSNRANGTFTRSSWPTTGSHVFSLESSSSIYRVLVDGTQIGSDTAQYHSGTGANWTIANRATNGQQLRGDIPELILYNRVLTPTEANLVGGYLAQKYTLTTAYPPLSAAVPTGVVASPLHLGVRLDWATSSGATSYKVKRSATPGGPYSEIYAPSTTTYNDMDPTLVPGTTYHYVIVANNSQGDSAPSAEVSAAPSAGPVDQIITFSLGAAVTKTAIEPAFPDVATSTSGLTLTYSSDNESVASVDPNTGTVTLVGVTGTAHIIAARAADADFNAASASQTLTVIKATPVITWANPATIGAGTPLSATQLNATSGGVAGDFVYTPPSGTVLPVGAGQVLSVQFTPADTATYEIPAAKTCTITVATIVTSSTTALNTGSSATGSEILNTGTLVAANHFGGVSDGMSAPASTTLANNLTFGTNTSHMASGWYPMHSTNAWSGAVAIANAGYKALLSDVFWIAYGGSVSYLTIPSLTPGNTYRLQMISINPQSASVSVEGNVGVSWSGSAPSVFTATWVQSPGDTSANIVLSRTSGEINFNGYALHDITPPKLATSFSNLTLSQTIAGGNASVTLGGTISAAGPVYPANGESVHVMIDGVTHDATISGGAGGFSLVFPTDSIPVSATPYPITYTYDGSSTLLSAVDASTALTVSAQSVPTITSWPTCTAITYGQALTSSSLNGDGLASVPGVFTFTDDATKPAAAGTYHASGTFTPSRTDLYATVLTPGAIAVTVNQATLSLASAAVTPKPYDGTPTATITGNLVGVLDDDLGQVSLAGTGTFVSMLPANNIAVNAACTLNGAKAANYSLTQPLSLTGDITQALLRVAADNYDRIVGAANPSLTYTVSGYQGGDNASSVGLSGTPVLTTDALPESPEGTYTITCTQNPETPVSITDPNYSLSFVNGQLRVIGLMTWAAGNGFWDIETTSNWSTATLGVVPFTEGAAVLFDDSPAGAGPFTVILTTTVHPASVTVNNPAKNYIIDNSGNIGGAATLVKQGNGTLTVANVNSYSGGTTVLEGTLNPHGNGGGGLRAYFGSGTVTMADGTTLKVTDPGGQPVMIPNAFHLSGGTVNVPIPLAGAGDPWLMGPISGPGGLSISGGVRTLNLGGLNTYSGNTVINSNNILHLLDNAQLTFVLGATSGTNNSLSGSGSATLDGDFAIDTTAADALTEGTWTLENVPSLSGAYGSTFSVKGFIDAGGDKWTKSETVGAKINTWSFDETTGVLTLTSVPGGLPPAIISAVTPSQIIPYGTLTVPLSGTVSDGASVYPVDGESVIITINEVPHTATIAGGAGAFSLSVPTATLPANVTPYTITYSYTGGTTLSAATPNTGTTLTVTAVTDPFADWINTNYPALSNKEATGDPDGDGKTNFEEYAFGLNPNSSSSVDPITRQLNKATGTFLYIRRATPAITGLVYKVYTSTTLAADSWVLDDAATQTLIGTDVDVETVEVTLSGTKPLSGTKLFVRVEASPSP